MELVKIVEGQVCTSSRLIADRFGKEHRDVLKAVRNLECSEEFSRRNFAQSDYMDSRGKAQPEYSITHDGFSFLVMGFTGKEAAQFKEQFIDAFNEMEKRLVPSDDEMTLMVLRRLQQSVERTKFQLIEANKTIVEQAPIVKFANDVLDSEGLIPLTVIAKDLGISAKTLNKMLYQKGVHYKVAETWVLYSKYQSCNYTKTKTHPYTDTEGRHKTAIHTYWTELGRRFIHGLFNKVLTA